MSVRPRSVSCSEKKPVPKFSSKCDFPLRSSSVVSTPQVDAIWGEEVAMSITLLLASIVVSVPTGVVQIDAASSTCTSPGIMIGSHKTAPQQSPSSSDGRLGPSSQPEGKSPSALLPECRIEPQKRRKRKSDCRWPDRAVLRRSTC